MAQTDPTEFPKGRKLTWSDVTHERILRIAAEYASKMKAMSNNSDHLIIDIP